MEKYLLQHLDEEMRRLQSVTQQMEECIHSKNHEVDRLVEVILRAEEGRKNSTNQILSSLATAVDKINSFEDGKPVNSSESEVKFVSDLKSSGNVIEGESSSGKRCRTVPSRIPSFTQFGRTLKDLGHIKGIDGVEIRGSQKSLSACKLSVRQSSCVKGVSEICPVGQDTSSGLDVLELCNLKEKKDVGPFKVNVSLVNVEMDKIISYLFEKSLKSSDILVDTEFHQLERHIFQTLAPSQNINGEVRGSLDLVDSKDEEDNRNMGLTSW
ncbi:hypothetical protein CsatB_027371 [Cannabis sativa]